MQQVVASGGEVWFGDETTVREFPPLRAAWARRGEQQVVLVSGRNDRRVILGALNARTGELVPVVRERCRTAEVQAAVAALGQVRPGVPKLLVWDNAPPHHPRLVRQTAAEAGIEIAWLPFRAPELNPCEDLWRHLKNLLAANRVYPTVSELAARAVAWLTALTPHEVLHRAGLASPKFSWLPMDVRQPLPRPSTSGKQTHLS
jgi:hypothetical protein